MSGLADGIIRGMRQQKLKPMPVYVQWQRSRNGLSHTIMYVNEPQSSCLGLGFFDPAAFVILLKIRDFMPCFAILAPVDPHLGDGFIVMAIE
jgi:hypothetical protein